MKIDCKVVTDVVAVTGKVNRYYKNCFKKPVEPRQSIVLQTRCKQQKVVWIATEQKLQLKGQNGDRIILQNNQQNHKNSNTVVKIRNNEV